MKKIKTIIDREPVSSDYIQTKQDFGSVLSQAKNLKPPVWKSMWFYGPVGMAVVAVAVTAVTMNPTDQRPTETANVSVEDLLQNQLEQHSPIASIQVAAVHSEDVNEEDSKKDIPVSTSSNTEIEVDQSESDIQNEASIMEEPVIEVVPSQNPRVEEKPKSKNMFPHIEGYFNGEIPVSVLGSDKGIQLNDDIKVVAFDIHYESLTGPETASIVGNKVPAKVLEKIGKYNIGYMVFITDLKGVDRQGKVLSLPSLNFIATN